ncbi:MAG TPA: FeoB-associated Cys-rich membrane protein [Anseongella sp.]|nr:FeoB-associated Cys-rich membrane protein [Anseongella sp.]
MDFQAIVVGILFAAASFYVGRIVYRMFRPKPGKGCGAGCKCSVDFSAIGKTGSR